MVYRNLLHIEVAHVNPYYREKNIIKWVRIVFSFKNLIKNKFKY